MGGEVARMLVGVDSTKYPGAAAHDAAWLLQEAARSGMEGVFFRSVTELSATLDRQELADVRACARQLGLRLEAGVGKVNPFSTPESPAIRALGHGDYRAAINACLSAFWAKMAEAEATNGSLPC